MNVTCPPTHTHSCTHTHHTNTLWCNSHKIGNRLLTCACPWIPETCTHTQAHTHTHKHTDKCTYTPAQLLALAITDGWKFLFEGGRGCHQKIYFANFLRSHQVMCVCFYSKSATRANLHRRGGGGGLNRPLSTYFSKGCKHASLVTTPPPFLFWPWNWPWKRIKVIGHLWNCYQRAGIVTCFKMSPNSIL